MRVLYDYQAFMQEFGGVSNCFVQLISNLPKEVDYEVGVIDSGNAHLQQADIVETQPFRMRRRDFICRRHFPSKGHLYDLYQRFFPNRTSEGVNQKYTEELLRSGQFDIFHPTYFNPYFLDYLGQTPMVLTVHDMTPELENKHDVQRKWKRQLVGHADHIVAVSEKTRDDVVRLMGVDEEKVTVIYHAACALPPEVGERLIQEPYILYVGSRQGYKNFEPMLRDMAGLLRRRRDLRLVCTGNPFTARELKLMKELDITDSLVHRYVDDCELDTLYAHALCFVFPSLHEGFGMPILEAYRADCPVLLNRTTCFPEIAGDAAVYFDLNGQQATLGSQLEDFLNWTDSQRDDLLRRQRQRLARFSWKESARQLSAVYQRVLAQR